MNLRQIEIFQAVMESGSVTGAARLLNISQPSVSKMLKHLETRLGLVLFKRIGGRIVPTPEAQALHFEVERVYTGLRSIQKIAEEMRQGKTGNLAVAATAALGQDFMPRTLAAFLAEAPNVHASLLVRRVPEVEELVLSQQVDMALVLFPSGSPAMSCRTIAIGHMVCVVPQDHPLAGAEAVGVREIERYPLISFDTMQPFGRLIANFFHNAGHQFRLSTHVELCSAACALVRAGAGIAIVDEFTVPAFPELRAVPLYPPLKFAVSLLKPSHRPMSIVAEGFLRHLDKALVGRVLS